MDIDRFTWFPKLTKVAESVPEEYQGTLLMALIRYGTYGEEPELEWPLSSIFESLREDIENSWNARLSGSKGGSSKKKRKGGSEVAEGALQDCKTTLAEDAKGGSEVAEPIPYQSIPSHTKPNQSESAKRKRFAPPTREEALAYGGEIGLPETEVDRFLDHFTANGWRVSGKAPMKDWHASMRNWKRNVGQFSPPSDAPKPIPKPVNAVDPDEELERLEREYREKFGEEP